MTVKKNYYSAYQGSYILFVARLSAVYTLIVFLSGCLGPKKINSWVSEHYNGAAPTQSKKKNEDIVISSKIVGMGSQLSITENKTSHVLPLLIYWQLDYKNTCTLNPEIPANGFISNIMSNTGRGLRQKLNGRRLELEIEQIPNVFAIDDKGHMIWLIYAFSWDVLTIQPDTKDLIVSYRLLNEKNEETKRGTITIPDSDKMLTLKMFQSLKKKTFIYLEQYDANITLMSKRFVEKMTAEL
ncbi:MAG: hypothetical protein JST75_20830 [Bacteroidetes bacterium]|nr:hypothetical protein [Bacteroidota bacterium]